MVLALVVVHLVALMVALPMGQAQAAPAEENAAVGKITLLNRQAIEEYRKLNFDEAQRLLDQALDLAAGAGLTQHPVRARTYVTLGVVSAGGLKRRDVAVRLFRKALQIQPEIQLSAELGTPEVQAAFDEAVQGLGNEPKLDRLPSELLVHDPLTTGVRGDAITVAVTPDEALHADRLTLAYRAAGSPTFSKVRMQKQSDGVFEGIVPAPATVGPEVAYYIEARDLDDKLVASRGSPVAPMVIALAERAGGAVASAPAVGGAVVAAPGAGTTGAGAPGGAGAAGAGAVDGSRLLIALLVGSGGGWSRGSGEATGYPTGGTKFGWAKVGHLAPQIGYLVTPNLMISAWGRLQLVSGADAYHTPAGSTQCGGDGSCGAAKGAFAGLLAATWLFGGADSDFRPFVSLSAGAGVVRHVVRINAQNNDCGADANQSTCLDTTSTGPFLGGPGIGFHLRLSRVARLVFSVQGLFGAPTFTTDIDADLGVAFLL